MPVTPSTWNAHQGAASWVWYSSQFYGVAVYWRINEPEGYVVLCEWLPDVTLPTLDAAQRLAETVSTAARVSVTETVATF